MIDHKHPDCEDRCQLFEHKGYVSCELTGVCQFVEGFDLKKPVCQGCNAHPVGEKFIWRREADGYHRELRCDDCIQGAQEFANSERIKRDRDSNDPHNWPPEKKNQGGWLGSTFTIPESKK